MLLRIHCRMKIWACVAFWILLFSCTSLHSAISQQQIKTVPKSELHMHLGGAWPLAYLKEHASSQEFAELCLLLDEIQTGRAEYHALFGVFRLIGKIVHSEQLVQEGVVALCHELLSEGVVYAELRTGLKDLGSGVERYLEAVLRVIEHATRGTSLHVGVLLSLRRDTGCQAAEETVDLAIKYSQKGVVGLDISGDSTQGNGQGILSAVRRAKEHHLPVTLHIGETQEETAPQQMMELSTIQPERIGHGVHLCEEAQRWILDNRVPIELCLTSALKAGMIAEAREHPALQLLLQGHPVAICTDDPLIFQTSLSEEYNCVATAAGLTVERLYEMQQQVQAYRFSSVSAAATQ